MNRFGYFGIAFLISIENVFPPIPSEVILTFAGFMTSNTNMTITGVIIVSTIGSVAGAIILYLLGRLLTKERLYKLVDGKITFETDKFSNYTLTYVDTLNDNGNDKELDDVPKTSDTSKVLILVISTLTYALGIKTLKRY